MRVTKLKFISQDGFKEDAYKLIIMQHKTVMKTAKGTFPYSLQVNVGKGCCHVFK